MSSRRRCLRLALACCAGGLAGCTSDRRTETTDPGRSGSAATTATPATPPSTESGTETETPAPGDVAWRQSLAGVVDTRPALARSRLFVGTEAGTVAAVWTGNGRVEWTYDLGSAVHGTPVVAAGTVLVVSGHPERQVVTALDGASGDRRWRFAPNEWLLDVLGTRDGTAYIATADDAREASGQTLYARSVADGSRRWASEVGDNAAS